MFFGVILSISEGFRSYLWMRYEESHLYGLLLAVVLSVYSPPGKYQLWVEWRRAAGTCPWYMSLLYQAEFYSQSDLAAHVH